MKIAVINAGSSSLKLKLFDMEKKEILNAWLIEHIGEDGYEFANHQEALESIGIDFSLLDAIGHRVVHGGEKFLQSVIIDDEVIKELKKLIPLAPLHNPANIKGIEVARKKAKDIPHIAVFDTAFHSTMPIESFLYALPYELYEKHHIRRYGFHGTSHAFVAKEAAKLLQKDITQLNLITIHLGNGASMCAIQKGKSIDTSMGFTPLEGLVMGTRSGDIDPAIGLYLQRELQMSVDEVDHLLNKQSGLLGICQENDVRAILANNDELSHLAIKIMTRRIKKYIGAYMALLEDVDGVVFTGGIGENSQIIRDMVMESKLFQNLKVFVIKTNEELEIANECLGLVKSKI